MRKDRGSRTKKQWNQRKNLKCVGWGPWLSLLPQTVETLQVRQRDVSLRCHCDFWPFSLAQESESHLCPLHYLRREKRQEKRKRRKFYIYPDVTHTHNVPWQCISVYICIYVCMYMCIYIHTHIYIYLWYILYTCIYIYGKYVNMMKYMTTYQIIPSQAGAEASPMTSPLLRLSSPLQFTPAWQHSCHHCCKLCDRPDDDQGFPNMEEFASQNGGLWWI